jgi:DNA-directed RNA polymerase specialized sigma subunit
MTTKEYLGQISRLNRMINNKLTEIAQLKDMVVSISAPQSGDRVQTTPNFDKIGTKYAKIDEMERKIDGMVDELVDKKEKIIQQIDSMEDENTYNILFARYIEKKTFEVIATEMKYSWRQVVRLHGTALKQFEKKYGEEYLNEQCH